MVADIISTFAAVNLVAVLLLIARLSHAREESLQNQTAFAETVWDGLPVPAFLLNENGELRRLNVAAETLLRISNANARGKALAEFIRDDADGKSTARNSKQFAKLLSFGGTATVSGQGADGQAFPMQIRTRRVMLDGTVWILGTAQDATEEFRVKDALGRHLRQLLVTKDALQRHNIDLETVVAEQTSRLVDARDAAEKANAAKSMFLANVSHELRTPLHAILSFARFGVRRFESADREKLLTYFERIESSGTTLLALLNSLLDLAKLESGAVELHRTLVDASTIVTKVTDELSGIAHDKSITLTTDVDTSQTTALLDTDKFAQVVRNLIGNAFKFTPAGGHVRVVLDSSADTLIVSVKDTGPGIPNDECEAVFAKFVQSTNTQSGAGGTGLGLTISREIVRLHGGDLKALPTNGQGAHLEIRIPLPADIQANTEISDRSQSIVPDHALAT